MRDKNFEREKQREAVHNFHAVNRVSKIAGPCLVGVGDHPAI